MLGFISINLGKPCSVRLNVKLGITGRDVRGVASLAYPQVSRVCSLAKHGGWVCPMVIKVKRVSRESFFRTAEEDKAPGLFHIIEPDGFIGWRTGLILERHESLTYACNVVLSIKAIEKKEFMFDFGRQVIIDWPVHFPRVSWYLPKWFEWPDDWRCLRPAHFVGRLEVRWGTEAMSLL